MDFLFDFEKKNELFLGELVESLIPFEKKVNFFIECRRKHKQLQEVANITFIWFLKRQIKGKLCFWTILNSLKYIFYIFTKVLGCNRYTYELLFVFVHLMFCNFRQLNLILSEFPTELFFFRHMIMNAFMFKLKRCNIRVEFQGIIFLW